MIARLDTMAGAGGEGGQGDGGDGGEYSGAWRRG